MKKIYIFLLMISIVFASALFIKPKHAQAESNYYIKITTNAISSADSDLDKYVFKTEYSKNSTLEFVAQLFDGSEPVLLENLNYKWVDVSTETIISENSNLILDKIYSDTPTNLILVGDKIYRIIISGTGIEKSADLKVDVADDENHELIITNIEKPLEINSSGAYILTNNSGSFTINALLAKSKVDCTINWYIKTPNSSTYDLMYENDNFYFEPTKLINSENGYGTYKIYASAQSSSILYTSKIIYFEGVAGNLNSDLSVYKIIKRVINNTKSELEAYTFTLENAKSDGLDFNKILWFINDVKLGKGQSFSYEPTTSEPFVVSVKYQNGILTPLCEMETTPKSTGTLKLILYILGGVLVLSIIFSVSVKALNKKRDVIW